MNLVTGATAATLLLLVHVQEVEIQIAVAKVGEFENSTVVTGVLAGGGKV